MGLTVIDAGVVIGLLDSTDAHHVSATRALTEALGQAEQLVMPASAYAECLISPSRRGAEAVRTVDGLLDALPATVEPVSREIGAMAADLRARHGRALRLPDALVVATALVLGAERLVTTDGRWPRVAVHVDVLRPEA